MDPFPDDGGSVGQWLRPGRKRHAALNTLPCPSLAQARLLWHVTVQNRYTNPPLGARAWGGGLIAPRRVQQLRRRKHAHEVKGDRNTAGKKIQFGYMLENNVHVRK